jgi:5'-nucleotidase
VSICVQRERNKYKLVLYRGKVSLLLAMSSPIVILVDMDNTVFDLKGAIQKRWNLLYPDKPAPTHHKSWELIDSYEELYPGFGADAADDILRKTHDLFDNLEPIDGAVEALNKLKARGCEVFFCTSPIGNYHNCLNQKYDCVKRHFGTEWVNRIILTRDKTVVHGDALIDDKPRITGIIRPSWWHVIYSQSYNQDRAGITWKYVIDNTGDFLAKIRLLKHLPRDHPVAANEMSAF